MENNVESCVYESYIISIRGYINELKLKNKRVNDEAINEYIDYTQQDLNSFKRNTLTKRAKYMLFNAILNRTNDILRNSSKTFLNILSKITEKTKETRLII